MFGRYQWHPTPPSRVLKGAWLATSVAWVVILIAMWRDWGPARRHGWWIMLALIVVQLLVDRRWPRVRPRA